MINLQLWKSRKKELKLNYAQIAEIAGVSKRTIEDIFRGFTTDPRVDTVQRIERALGLSGDGYRDTMPFEVTPIEEEVIRTFRALSDEDKQLFLILLKKFNK